MIAADDPAWRASISNGVLGGFRADLHRDLGPEDRLRAVHLLRAVAFAYGRRREATLVEPSAAASEGVGHRELRGVMGRHHERHPVPGAHHRRERGGPAAGSVRRHHVRGGQVQPGHLERPDVHPE